MTGGIAWQQGWWWTIFSAIYLHGSLLHIFFNLMWVRQLGPNVTEVYGPARSFIIFTVGGAAGFLASNLLSGAPTIGASGSIFGLLAALIVYGRRRRIAMLSAQLWQWAIIMFVMGFMMSGVNNWAHLGGFAGGWARGDGHALRRREARDAAGAGAGARAPGAHGLRRGDVVRERDAADAGHVASVAARGDGPVGTLREESR